MIAALYARKSTEQAGVTRVTRVAYAAARDGAAVKRARRASDLS